MAVLASLAVACGSLVSTSAPTPAEGRLTIGDERIELDVHRCADIGGRFAASLPVEGAETTLTATGRTDTQDPVGVQVRRTRSAAAPHVVQSVEIGLGDPERSFEALVLYRAFDEDTGRWTSIDPDAASSRVDAAGPLLELGDGRVRATGVARRAGTGTPVTVTLEADCPLELDEDPGLAVAG